MKSPQLDIYYSSSGRLEETSFEESQDEESKNVRKRSAPSTTATSGVIQYTMEIFFTS